jgi:ubiquinone/menaquinone biosynthesis C-methylase UbiE
MSEFEELYLKVREKEQRLYTDVEVSELPLISSAHPHYYEWRIRQSSFRQLLKYLQSKNKPLQILDLGCGNGWMTNKLSSIPGSTVVGIDINGFELEQAKRVFYKSSRVSFQPGNILNGILFNEQKFDVIVMAASVQYFSDIQSLLEHLKTLLKENGEIHILDSHFYSEKNIDAARQATRDHYKAMGCEQMSEYYHHHLWSQLSSFNYVLKNRSLIKKITLKLFKVKQNYFPWIIIYE